ncbi:hypothetical protein SDC9_91149 [bioreactor metagenome]|uniref:Uncharacterized protein n=1 Tax=bioreactor metagenome TaxID=1076179 RepID=A0A644ZX15_9ZZZZ
MGLQAGDLLLHRQSFSGDARFLEFFLEVFFPHVPFVREDGTEGSVGDVVLFPRSLPHPVVEDPLVVVDPLGLEDHVFFAQRCAGDGFVDVKVVLHVLRDFRRFDAFVPDPVVLRLHVVPRELAHSHEGEPEAEVGEVEQGFRFVFEGGDLFVHHVHEDDPRFVVLGALEGEEVPSPLGHGFLAPVLGDFKSLAFHADLFHDFPAGAVPFREDVLHFPDAFAHGGGEFVPAVHHAVDEFHELVSGTEPQLQSVCVLFGEKPQFVAFADEGESGAERDGVEGVVVGVVVGFDGPQGVEDAHVGPEAGGGFVFGAVHGDFFALVGAGAELKAVHSLGAGHGAPVPAAVGVSLGEVLFVFFRGDGPDGLRSAKLEVVHRQDVVVVHDFVEVRGAGGPHDALHVVVVPDFTVELGPHFLEGGQVGGSVFGSREAPFPDDEGEDPLVPQYGASPSPSGLLEPGDLPPGVVEADVQGSPIAVLGGTAGADDGDGDFVVLVFGETVVESFGDVVGVPLLRGRRVDADLPFVAVDGDDHVFRRFPRDGEGVEARRLEVGTEVPSGVAVVGLVREGRQEDGVGFAGAGVLGDAADGAPGDDEGVFGGVPPALRGDGVPENLEAETPASGVGADHVLVYVMDGMAVLPVPVPEVYDEVFAGVAPVQGGPVVTPFGEELHVVGGHGPTPPSRCL